MWIGQLNDRICTEMDEANKERTKEIKGQMSIAEFTQTVDGKIPLNSVMDYQNVGGGD